MFPQINTIILGVCVWPSMPKLPKIISLPISLQYFKKELSVEVDFLLADKHESFLQINTMVFDGDGQAFLKFPK